MTTKRMMAHRIFLSLHLIREGLLAGKAHHHIIAEATKLLGDNFKLDYISIRNRHSLEPAKPNDKEVIILMAAWLGKARLIDNLQVDL